jgi:hypothetical protein
MAGDFVDDLEKESDMVTVEGEEEEDDDVYEDCELFLLV